MNLPSMNPISPGEIAVGTSHDEPVAEIGVLISPGQDQTGTDALIEYAHAASGI